MIEVSLSAEQLSDRTAVDEAINRVRAAGGGIIRFPGGTFDFPSHGEVE
jgi:hypothetical protein